LQEEEITGEYPAPYFIDYIKRLITYDPRFVAVGETVSDRTNRLFQGGLEIYTTIDMDAQAAAEEAVRGILPYENDPAASMVAIEPDTGHVKALVGGKDWFASRKEDPYAKLNLAILAEPGLGCTHISGTDECANRAPGTGRQAGSAFKPFALAAALENGIPLSKTYKAGACMDFASADAGGNWHVCNYEGGDFGGELSLLEATVSSVNVVYAQLILEVGEQEVVDVADDMGINIPLLAVPSAALGTNVVNPLGMASGYASFATNGIHNPPVGITRIVDKTTGKTIYEDESEPVRALDPGVAYLTTTALEAVIDRGTGVRAQIARPAAGKTGTAQEYRDAWFGGYTPDLAAAVWVGYPEGEIEMKASCAGSTSPCRPTRIDGTGVTGGSYPAMIWQRFMATALVGVPASDFQQPDIGLVTVIIDSRTGCLAGSYTPDEYAVSATFARGTEPEEKCRSKRPGVRVPDVFSYPASEARELLERAGFAVNEVDEPSSTYPPGRVVGQSPEGGETAPEGSTVTIYISVADNRTSVPDVLGMSSGQAQSTLRNAGFDVTVISESEPGRRGKSNKNRVWKQSPSAGTPAEQGSNVTIWVNP
jgi:penicillin-binding protein 1A